ncbi:histone-lysine N-methyltransferase, H3 lysine-9 specific SUVH4-like [Bidens hawaiensis]|uniref:histone-lysine N-methyltransferase, H3 lysine-9 specific SUVH4-like n=1 Tax=Bidens hawaiensis TaxID=980011 RepID=UPI00404B0DDC
MESSAAALDVSVTKKFGQRVQKLMLESESESSKMRRRSSPRLRENNHKRPYYGPQPLSLITKTPIQKLELEVDFTTTYAPPSRDDIAMVKKTLRLYNKYYLQNANAIHPPDETTAAGKPRSSINRPDLKAISKMIESNEILFPTKRFGHLPGVNVGYQFYSRAEMVALGLHSHWLNGIDYMGLSYKTMLGCYSFKGYTFPIAIAIVLSGQYEDDQDNSEDIAYTGQGGNDFTGGKHQFKNQEMSRGNLALKNSMEPSIPVRVIRGHTGDNNFKIYTYDGLYTVSEFWPAEGVSGFIVYKYRLKRLAGQPILTSNQVQYSNVRSRASVKAPQLVSLDITEGQEDMHIPVINAVDDATITGFTYTKYNQVLSNLKLPPNADGCDCKGFCKNTKTCSCARLNGADFPYVRSNGGRLIEAKDVVFECGPNCGCGPGCINRVSQGGIKYQLEIFRTKDRGWAVKTKDFIPSGAPVCEYIGELRRTNELDNVAENDYIFEIDCWQTMKGIGGRERRQGDVSECLGNNKLDENSMPEPEFCVDAGRIGNVARFINHSCDPNLFVQCVLSSHHDLKLARVLLFASDNIAPMQELTYDYGYALDSVVDNDGNVRMLPCHCGTSECRKRLY